jgi:multiple sugar transport system permease protein
MIRNPFRRRSLFGPSPIGMALSYLALGVWSLVVLFPLYWLAVTSLKLPIDVNTGPFYVPFVDFQPSLHAWHYILVGDLSNDTIRPYVTTIIVALTSSVLSLLLGTAAAYGLTRFEYRPRVGAVLTSPSLFFYYRRSAGALSDLWRTATSPSG